MKKSIQFLAAILIFLLTIAFSNPYEEVQNTENSIAAVDQKTIDANSIETWFRSNGSFNRDPGTGNAGFRWPISTSNTARYASGMWIGAKIGNDTNVTVCNYAYEYFPGYTDNNGNPQGFDSGDVYKIYKITRNVQNSDRQQWPNSFLGNSNQGAPVYYDQSSSSWKPLDFGEQTMFYLYTDSYPSTHTATGGSTSPLKADIKQLNFAERIHPGGLYATIFSQFIVINRSTVTWEDAFFSFWTDDDLGDGSDDVKGCDSALQLCYTYNYTNSDPVYGASPPSVGTILLKGVTQHTGNPNDVAEYCMNNVRIVKHGFRNQGIYSFASNGAPANYVQSYRLMNGLRADGTIVMNPAGFATKLFYTGDPVAGSGWNQTSVGDQRFMFSSGPVNVSPGDTQVIVIAQVIARGTSNLNSITKLREYSEEVTNFYRNCYDLPLSVNNSSSTIEGYSLDQNFPNPFNPQTKIEYFLKSKSFVQLNIYNALGELINTLVSSQQEHGKHSINWNGTDRNGHDVSSGIYIYKISTGDFTASRKMVLIR